MKKTLLAGILVGSTLLIAFLIDRDRGDVPVGVQQELSVDPTLASIRGAMEERLAGKGDAANAPTTAPDAAGAFLHAQRVPIGADEVPMQRLYDRLQEIKVREASLSGQHRGSLPGGIQSWQSIGPGNVGGRTRAIAIDPTNSSRIFAAGVAGGIWLSTDAGASWTPVDDLMLNLAVCALVIDPTNPDVMYAGTGEGYGNGIFLSGLGIFKSTDGGQSFQQIPSTAPSVTEAFRYVQDIVISANDSNRLYAATRHGVFRSTDAGDTWEVVLANPVYNSTPPTTNGCQLGALDLVARTDRNPDVLFAAFGNNQSDGLYRSDDGGDTWITYTTPSYQGRMTIAIAPSDQDRVYLCMSDNGGLAQYGRLVNLWRADDGQTFNPVLDLSHKFSPWLLSYAEIALGCLTGYPIYSQGWYDQVIAVDPVDPDVLFLGGIDQYRSDNAGVTFGMTGYIWYRNESPPNPLYMHPDQHAIVFDPNYDGVTNQTMYVGNDGGLFRTTNARAASTQEECPVAQDPGPPPDVQWEELQNGYATTQFYHGDAAQDRERFAGGSQDNGTNGVDGTTSLNGWTEYLGGDGGYVAIDPTNGDIVYAEIQFFPTIEKSIDGGVTFVDATNGITDTDGLFIAPFAMDPSNPEVLWTGGTRPWRTTNGAALWTVEGPNFSGGNQISAIAIAPADGNYVYMGFNNGYIARTTDGLAPTPTWSVTGSGLPVGAWVSDIAVDPVDPEIVYATYSTVGVNHVFRSTNGGASWTNIDGISAVGIPDIPVHTIAVRPTNSDQLYVGTEFGVFVSEDDGGTWDPANIGLAHTVVEELDFPDANTLVAFTFGRGAFVATLDPVVSVPDAGGALAQVVMSVATSPIRSSGAFHLDLPDDAHVRLGIYDVRGRLVAELVNELLSAGRTTVRWDGRSRAGMIAAPGAYLARLETGATVLTEKVVLVR